MANVIVTQGFIQDLSIVESSRVLSSIINTVELLETVPDLGSKNLSNSIKNEFGESARKIPVKSFDIITIYNETSDEVMVAGLIHQRKAW